MRETTIKPSTAQPAIRLPRLRLRHLSVLLLAAALAIAAGTGQAQVDRIELPDMGTSAQTVLSPRFEKEYGEALLRQMRAYDVLIEDPQITDYFRDMGYRLVSHGDRPDKHFSFVVIKDSNINAFAAPGGVVALNTGLILAADNESEVAGVLAHEVSHVTQLHLARAMENAQKVSIPTMLAMLGLILAAGGSGDAIQGAVLGSQALMAQNQINFTRQNEHEADRLGIQTLSSAGYNPLGMADFFSKLGRLTRANGEGPPEYLRTHPMSSTRVAEASARAAQLPAWDGQQSLEFRLVRARLRVLQEEYPNDATRYFTHQLETEEFTPINLQANRYGLALSYLRSGRLEQARELADGLLAERPQQLAYQILQAEIDQESRDYQAAVVRLNELYLQFPGNHIIATHLVRALLATGSSTDAEQAGRILREQLLTKHDDPVLYDLYAQAADLSGDKVRSVEAVAEAQFLRGRLHEAVLRLRELTRDEQLNYYQRARINARLAELEILLAESREQRQS